ncbi:hypothetical protein F53441_11409 [Fusarium austroafricanum]|uniref:Spc7 kinetochore protein domain-containing protein n=1 Tax=Fusarium austroafricanum TaxID=2364996 RepID=A0A8H4K5C5_9HYPO|nr:hypothetical protein F53441_11409 [Fusarium austroafricanum]
MAPVDATLLTTRRTRRSIGAHTDVNKAFEKENATVDVTSSLAASRKKSRSKSLGPGGLDALMKANGNRRASLAAPSRAPRSILKQTMPIPEIPPMKSKHPDLIDFGEPTKEISTPNSTDNSGSKIAVKTEEEQQAAAREREERERRDARRKSLANRRVSFAAEATLHTFHEVEFNQDSTTSTDSTRRNSAFSNAAAQQRAQDDEEKKQRRSSGLPPVNFHNSEDDTVTTLYSSDSEPADAVEEIADVEEDGDDDSSESDDGTMMTVDEVTGTTAASDRSIDSDGESSTLDEALRLAARRAGNQQLEDEEDEDLDDDEEFIPMFGWGKENKNNIAAQDQENLPPPPRIQPTQPKQDTEDATETNMSMDMDMDMTRAVGGIIKPQPVQQYDPDEDMSMDVTRVIGGIIKSQPPQEHNPDEDMSMDVTRAFGGIVNRPQEASALVQDEDEQDEAPMEEATMEFTTAIGGIRRPAPEEDDESDGNEDMSMELTTVMGGVLTQNKRKSMAASRRRTVHQAENEDEDAPMDMTLAVGQILPKPVGDDTGGNEDEDENDATMGMDMTTAIGGILSKATGSSRNLGKRTMEEEANSAKTPDDALQAAISKSVVDEQLRPPFSDRQTTTPTPGPSGTPRSTLRNNPGPKLSTPQENRRNSRTPSPAKATTTPQSLRARTPKSAKPATPQLDSVVSERIVTPRSAERDARSASPKRPSSARATGASSRTPSPVKSTPKQSLFQSTLRSGDRTPTVVPTPQRNLTGVGADRAGLGSPQVTALFDRRGSIGDMATNFVPGKRGVMFEDPKEMTEEVNREVQEEEDKENRRKIFEREADGAEATLNLREMIDSLSPKRKPLRGRKSLHVGSAKGLLGKRPNELDDDEDEPEDNDGVKRLKGHQGSPVKNIRLQQPPSKEETAGRLNFSFRQSLQPNTSTPTLSSPGKPDTATTPRHQGRFKDVEDDRAGHQVNFDETPVRDAEQLEDEAEAEAEEDGERIHLQDFLNMTSIRFMELTTTKRRHTQAPGTLDNGFLDDGEDDLSLERCVVAGACTVPMLELYQHSCRELKKYISEGRRIVKEIETDTFEENPPLFKEYMAATPEIKTLMDKQFMNVKNHARLLSKAMWYEWRMKLQEGLKEGLLGIDDGMEADKELLDKQKSLLDSVLPAIVARYKSLVEESSNLEEVARELADCNPADLEAARDELTSLDEDVHYKKKRIAELREQFQASEVEVDDLITQKQNCVEDIAESEKIREECRGWTSTEVNSLKARADAIEKEHGWSVTGISGTVLSMAYKREIEIVFDIASFQQHQTNSTIDLWYIAEQNTLPKTPEKEFFLQSIRDHVRALPHSRTEVSHLLKSVQRAWDKANLVSTQVDRLNATFPTTVERTSDSSMTITTSLLLVPLETRVEIKLNLQGQSNPEGLDVMITVEAKVLYDRPRWFWLPIRENCEWDSIFTAYECFDDEHTKFAIYIAKFLYVLEPIPFYLFLLFSLIGMQLTEVPAVFLLFLSVIMLLSIVLPLIIFLIFWNEFLSYRDVARSFLWSLCKIWVIISLPVVGFYFATTKFWVCHVPRKVLEWALSIRDDIHNGFNFEIVFPDPPSGSINPNDTRGELWMKQLLKEDMDRRQARRDEEARAIAEENLRQSIEVKRHDLAWMAVNSRKTPDQRFRRQLGLDSAPPVPRDSAAGQQRKSLAGTFRCQGQKTKIVMTVDEGTQKGPDGLDTHKKATKPKPEGHLDRGVQADLTESTALEERKVPVIESESHATEPQTDPEKYEPEPPKSQQMRPSPKTAPPKTQRSTPNPEPTFSKDAQKTKEDTEKSALKGESPEPAINPNVAAISKDTAEAKVPEPVTNTPVTSSAELFQPISTPTPTLTTPTLSIPAHTAEPLRKTLKKTGGTRRLHGRFFSSSDKHNFHYRISKRFGTNKSLELSVKKYGNTLLEYAGSNPSKSSTVNPSGIQQVNGTATSSNISTSLSEPIASEPPHLPLIGYQPLTTKTRGEATPEEISETQANLNQAVSIFILTTLSPGAWGCVQSDQTPIEPPDPVTTSQLSSSDGPGSLSYPRDIDDQLDDITRASGIDESDENIYEDSLDGHNDVEDYQQDRMEASLDLSARGKAPRDSDIEMSEGSESDPPKDVDLSEEDVIASPLKDIEMSSSPPWQPNEEEKERIGEASWGVFEDLMEPELAEDSTTGTVTQGKQGNFGDTPIQTPIFDSRPQPSNGLSNTPNLVTQSLSSQSSTNPSRQNPRSPFSPPLLPTAPPAMNFVWGHPTQQLVQKNEFAQPSSLSEATDYPSMAQSEEDELARWMEMAFLEDQEETTQSLRNTHQGQTAQYLPAGTDPYDTYEQNRELEAPDLPQVATSEQLSQRRIKKAVSRKHQNGSAQPVPERERSQHQQPPATQQQTTQQKPARVPESQTNDIAEIEETARNLLALAASEGIPVGGNVPTQRASLTQEITTQETNAQGLDTQGTNIRETRAQEPTSSTPVAEEKSMTGHPVTSNATSSQQPQNSLTTIQPIPAQPSPTQRTPDQSITIQQQAPANILPTQHGFNITQPKKTDTPTQTRGLIIPTDNPVTSNPVAGDEQKTPSNRNMPAKTGLGGAQQQQDVAPIQRGGLMFPGGNPTMHNPSAATAPTASQNAGPNPQQIEEFKRKQEAHVKARARKKEKAKSEGPKMFHMPRRNRAPVPSTPATPHHNLGSSTQGPSPSPASNIDASLESFFGPPGVDRSQGSLIILEAGQIPQHLRDDVAKDGN